MTTTAPPLEAESLDSPEGLLAAVREDRAVADAAEARVLAHVVAWAAMHAVDCLDDAVSVMGAEGELSIAGEGAPLVAEFCVAELAAALGMSSDAGRFLLAEAVELRHRLPRTWARVVCGDLVAWKARRIARQTLHLPQAGAGFVDTHVAPVAHRIGARGLDRLVEAARARFDPAAVEAERRDALERRRLEVETDQVSFDGLVRLYGELDLADALDLDQALTQRADQLAALGSTDSLDARRAIAVGDLARRQLTLDLNSEEPQETGQTGRPGRQVKPRQVVLHVHLSHAAISGSGAFEIARVRRSGGSSRSSRCVPGAPTPAPSWW